MACFKISADTALAESEEEIAEFVPAAGHLLRPFNNVEIVDVPGAEYCDTAGQPGLARRVRPHSFL